MRKTIKILLIILIITNSARIGRTEEILKGQYLQYSELSREYSNTNDEINQKYSQNNFLIADKNLSEISKFAFSKEVSNVSLDTGEPKHIIAINAASFLGQGLALSYQYNLSDSWNPIVNTRVYHIKWFGTDIFGSAWDADAGVKWYWSSNAPSGGYLRFDTGISNGHLHIKGPKTYDRISLWGYNLGIGETIYIKPMLLDYSLVMSITGNKSKEWELDTGQSISMPRIEPSFLIQIGFSF